MSNYYTAVAELVGYAKSANTLKRYNERTASEELIVPEHWFDELINYADNVLQADAERRE